MSVSYTKHEWQRGETITAAKLNSLEDGVHGAVTWARDIEGKIDELNYTDTNESGSGSESTGNWDAYYIKGITQ